MERVYDCNQYIRVIKLTVVIITVMKFIINVIMSSNTCPKANSVCGQSSGGGFRIKDQLTYLLHGAESFLRS